MEMRRKISLVNSCSGECLCTCWSITLLAVAALGLLSPIHATLVRKELLKGWPWMYRRLEVWRYHIAAPKDSVVSVS